MTSKLKKKLDTLFSRYIREKYADHTGRVKCVTCGVKKDIKEMQAGHYIPRNHLCTRWDETNVYPQCVGCNVFNKGRMDEYALFLVNKHGKGILDELNKKKHSVCQFRKKDYEELIERYK